MEIELSIITVTMNHLTYVKSLLDSLYNNDSDINMSFEMIIVDNCSVDGTVEYIKENYPQVIIVCNNTLKGFAENNNLGVKYSKGEYVAIINPDIILKPNSLNILVDYVKLNGDVGIVAPKLLNIDGTVQKSVRRFINIYFLLLRILYWGRDMTNNKKLNSYLLKNIDTNKIQKVDWAIGAALLLKKELFVQLDGFDKNFFLYVEDEDLCLRTWKKEKKVIYLPESEMYHIHKKESHKFNRKTVMHAKSMFYFIKKHKVFTNSYSFME